MSYADFLYPIKSGKPDAQTAALLDTADCLYASLLSLLATAFHLYDRSNGVDLQKSVRSMQAMDAVNKQSARLEYLPRFTLPDFARVPVIDPAVALYAGSAMLDRIEADLPALAGNLELHASAKSAIATHRAAQAEMHQAMIAAPEERKGLRSKAGQGRP
jgi:hypothetical protein